MGFGVLAVINGVFIQETFKALASDDTIMLMQKERQTRIHTKKMDALIAAADDSGDGLLDLEEFRDIVAEPQVRTWLAAQELNVNDPDHLFLMMDVEQKGHLSSEDIVKGVSRLKGAARSMDMNEMSHVQAEFRGKVYAAFAEL